MPVSKNRRKKTNKSKKSACGGSSGGGGGEGGGGGGGGGGGSLMSMRSRIQGAGAKLAGEGDASQTPQSRALNTALTVAAVVAIAALVYFKFIRGA